MISFQDLCKSAIFKLFLAFLGSYIMYLLAGFLLPLFLAVGLAFLLAPITSMFESLTVGKGTIPISRGVAIFLSFVVFGAFLALVVAVIAPPLLDQVNELLKHLPEYAAKAQVRDWQTFFQEGSHPALPSNLQGLVESFVGWAVGMLGTMLKGLISSSMGIVANLVGLIVVPFLSFYFLKDWRFLCEMFVDLFAPEMRPKVQQVLAHVGSTLGGYVQGLGKLCLISGVVVWIGTMCLGLNYTLVFAVIAILAETIPVFGPVVGAAGAIFTAYSNGVNQAVHTALFYTFYYLVDSNVLMPKIMGKTIDLPAVVLLIALMVGGKLFGILGMLFAVPVAAVYRVLYKELWHIND